MDEGIFVLASEYKIYYSVDVNQQTSILIDVPIKKEQQIWARDPKPLRKRHKRDNEKVFLRFFGGPQHNAVRKDNSDLLR